VKPRRCVDEDPPSITSEGEANQGVVEAEHQQGKECATSKTLVYSHKTVLAVNCHLFVFSVVDGKKAVIEALEASSQGYHGKEAPEQA
jgi:hypothetical protein